MSENVKCEKCGASLESYISEEANCLLMYYACDPIVCLERVMNERVESLEAVVNVLKAEVRIFKQKQSKL